MVLKIKSLIINADDFGLTESCTLAIIEAFKQGKITSTTICANGEYFEEAINLIFKNNLQNRVGIHINLTDGKPLTDAISLDSFFCDKDKKFHDKINRRKKLTKEQRQNAFQELSAQFEKIFANKITITHVDSHHHIHTSLNLVNVFLQVMKIYKIKKIRLTRNIGEMPFIKKLIKNKFNCRLKLLGFKSTELFGSIEDLKCNLNLNKSLELMVHPDFNRNGELIDRINYNNNNPIGDNLKIESDILKKFLLCSYYDGV